MTIPTITDDLLREIEAAAKAANSEQWKLGAIESGRMAVDSQSDREVTGWIDEPDAIHIVAANPANVLALTAHIRQLEMDAADHAKTLKDLKWRIEDTSGQLTTRRFGGDESLYGLDEWSTPIINLKTAVQVIDNAMQATQ